MKDEEDFEATGDNFHAQCPTCLYEHDFTTQPQMERTHKEWQRRVEEDRKGTVKEQRARIKAHKAVEKALLMTIKTAIAALAKARTARAVGNGWQAVAGVEDLLKDALTTFDGIFEAAEEAAKREDAQ